MSLSREEKAARIRSLMDSEGAEVAADTRHFNRGRYEAVADLDDYEALKDEARAIKEDAIERLPELVDELRAAVEANGANLYLADDPADANEYIREVVDDAVATDGGDSADESGTVVKSKSMTTEELEVNAALEAGGHEVFETDLGEFVIQVAGESPSHIVGPAIHKSREAIAELFTEHFDPDEPLETAEDLTRFAREHLLEKIEAADVGMTGANFVVAESGTIAIVTNEGNARKCAVAPDTHVAVAGVEKVIPSFEDLQPFAELIARSAAGQDISAYFSLLTPPTRSPTLDFENPHETLGPADDREFHLVLVDNGRYAMREDDQLRETLYCIRCGACSNACGNFQSVGGHVFGGETYSGGIATGWEAGIEGYDVAAEFNDLCTGCTRCVPACPVNIDVPWLNTVVRDRVNRGEVPGGTDLGGGAGHGSTAPDWLVEGLTPDAEPGGMDIQKRLFGNLGTLARLGSRTAPLSNWVLQSGPGKRALERLAGVDRRRDLPTFSRETLVDWFDARGPHVAADEAAREATLFADTITNYTEVERGKAAVRALEALDVHVRVPAVPDSGRAPLSQGMIRTAERQAEAVQEALAPHLEAGRDVVVLEPSDLSVFHREYGRLLPDAAAADLRANSYDAMEYVYGLLANGGDPARLHGPAETGVADVAYHPHCQGRTVGVAEFVPAVLEELGYDVEVTDTECCGMAGSFGYKREYYELSMDVGEPIRAQLGNGDGDPDRPVLATGASCLDHVADLLGRETTHPIEFVAPE